jgi:uracil-DNA glycosylase
MGMNRIKLIDSWLCHLEPEFKQPYMIELRKKLVQAGQETGFFPDSKHIFRALNETPLHRVKVVILGQDPYHGPNQAEGLSFSVPKGIPAPPSLKNIFKEMHEDLGILPPNHGHLLEWAQRGVLLLNSVLTVAPGQAGSHRLFGWERFTDRVLSIISQEQASVAFLLWGKFAHQKKTIIDEKKHLVLTAAHPSPLSAYQGFFGCRHFSQANSFLEDNGALPIPWQLSP